jgi:hypothetical protein
MEKSPRRREPSGGWPTSEESTCRRAGALQQGDLNENPRLESIEVSDDSALAGFLLDVVDTIFAEETDAFTTKTTPRLEAVPSIQPVPAVAMSRGGVSMGAG